jgi:hypothetical protein
MSTTPDQIAAGTASVRQKYIIDIISDRIKEGMRNRGYLAAGRQE